MVKLIQGLILATTLAGLFAVSASAQQPPTSQEQDQPRDGERRMGLGPREGFRSGSGGPMWRQFEPPTAEEWSEILDFMKAYSPERWKRFRDISDENAPRLTRMVVARYRMIQRLKREEPEVYQLRLARLKIEDHIFDLHSKLRDADGKTADDLRANLRQEIAALVDNDLEERQTRLALAEKRLEQEKKGLAAEKGNRQQTIEKRLRAIENEKGGLMGEVAPPDLANRSPTPNKTTAPANQQ